MKCVGDDVIATDPTGKITFNGKHVRVNLSICSKATGLIGEVQELAHKQGGITVTNSEQRRREIVSRAASEAGGILPV